MKKPHTIRKVDTSEASQMNENWDRLYARKIEGVEHNSSGTYSASIYQAIETGENVFSGTGSPTVTRSFGFSLSFTKILSAQAHAVSTLVTAHVTDVTGSSVTIECRTVSGTANFSAVTTGSIKVFHQVLGTTP